MNQLRLSLLAVAVVAAGCGQQPTPVGPPMFARQQTQLQTNDLVATPNGWYHRDCVQTVPDGAHVHKGGLVTRLDGSTFQLPVCSQPGRLALTTSGASENPADSGWMEWGSYDPGTAWGSINASWHAPTAPTSSYGTGQVLFSFPGLQTRYAAGATIQQPVLTYGNQGSYGGNYWSATSWSCGPTCTHSDTILRVSAGDSLTGSVTASSCASGTCTWTIVTVNVTTGHRSNLVVDDTSGFYYAVGGSLEVYDLTSCPDYPAGGTLVMGISLYNQSNTKVTPSWTKNVQYMPSPTCGFSVDTTSTSVTLHDNVGPAVYVTGVNRALPDAYVTATAHASGGVTPYSYAWTINGSSACGNSSVCSGYIGANGTITNFIVTVTNADLLTATGELSVLATCDPIAQLC